MTGTAWTRDQPSLRPQPARDDADWWPTPPWLVSAVIRFVLPALPGPIWEPAAGDGRLSAALRADGRTVLASDLVPRAPGVLRHDFLHNPPPAETRGAAVVTNPPFNALDGFIVRGLGLLDRGKVFALVLLLRDDALSAGKRAAALNCADSEWGALGGRSGCQGHAAAGAGRTPGASGARTAPGRHSHTDADTPTSSPPWIVAEND